ncbi:MAG: hypothetical protein ABWY19_01775, partial [Marmoricola sp.]
PSDLDRGYAQQALGYAALTAGLWDEAESALTASAELFEQLELPSLVRESTVGLAAAAIGRGDLTKAVALVEPVLEHLDVTGLSGTQVPGAMLLACHRVLVTAGDPRADSMREQARVYLRTMAEEVGEPGLTAGYLAFPAHAALLADDAA